VARGHGPRVKRARPSAHQQNRRQNCKLQRRAPWLSKGPSCAGPAAERRPAMNGPSWSKPSKAASSAESGPWKPLSARRLGEDGPTAPDKLGLRSGTTAGGPAASPAPAGPPIGPLLADKQATRRNACASQQQRTPRKLGARTGPGGTSDQQGTKQQLPWRLESERRQASRQEPPPPPRKQEQAGKPPGSPESPGPCSTNAPATGLEQEQVGPWSGRRPDRKPAAKPCQEKAPRGHPAPFAGACWSRAWLACQRNRLAPWG